MENQKIGAFICGARKARGLTQKQLAEALGVTDKAVSKWERGVSCPDISLLTPLAGALGVAVTELLAGEPQAAPVPEAEAQVQTALTYSASVAGQRWARARWYGFVGLTFSCLAAAFICFICDFATSERLSWSFIVLSSLVLGWAVSAPLLAARRGRILKAMLALTLLLLPYLGSLSLVLGQPAVFKLGAAIGPLSLAYLWLAFLLFKKLPGHRWTAGGILVVLAPPLNMAVNGLIERVLPGQGSSSDFLINLVSCLLLGAFCFGADLMLALGRRKGF
ncbi:helix-turn-helix domain-containing protein [Allofournierella sp.]|uniref:helix-turn-helix domain-containing protein n=1 Tax=Allofournierella sp. TaxID=1940256 RepID=UPI003AB84432